MARDFCNKHPEASSVGRCLSCRRGACIGCAVYSDAGLFCGEKCKKTYTHFYKEKPKIAKADLLSKLVGMLVPAALLAGLIYYLGVYEHIGWAEAILDWLGVKRTP